MKYYVLLWFVFITLSQADDRTVNVAIETSFQFEPKDINNEKGIVNNIKTFIDKIYRSLDPGTAFRAQKQPNKLTLSRYLTDLGNSILNLTDENLHSVATILNNHFQLYKANSRSYNRIFADPMSKKYFQKTVRYWSKTKAKELKKKLQKILKNGNPALQKLASELNAFYTENDFKLFYNYTAKVNKYLRKGKPVDKLLKEWIDFAIFDHFNELNETSKTKVMRIVRLLSDYFTGDQSFKAVKETDASHWSDHEEDVSGSVGEGVHTHHRHSHVKTKHDHRRNSDTIKNGDGEDDKTMNTLQLIEKLLSNDVLGNFEVYFSDANKKKH